jgi:predicted DsbA family dithiol-disulfide isomerase
MTEVMLMTAPAKLTIDIVSDVVCPWCIIGYRQLQQALSQLGGKADAVIRWHPFELVPGMPPEGQNLRDYSRERYGASPEQSRANRERLLGIGKNLGINFRYSEDSRIYNTRKAHELLHWAADSGKQTDLKLALFDAYFTDQANVSDTGILLEIVARVGLDPVEAQAVLDDGRYAAAVSSEISHWVDQNVTGVPAFIINGKYMIPGAQDAETFVTIFNRVLEKEAA